MAKNVKKVLITLTPDQHKWLKGRAGKQDMSALIRQALGVLYPDFPHAEIEHGGAREWTREEQFIDQSQDIWEPGMGDYPEMPKS